MLACETHEAMGAVSTPAFGDAVTTAAPGKELHGEECSAGPEEDPSLAIEQWCFPALRQQAGSLPSGSDANAVSGISERLKTPNNAMANARRTTA